MRLASIVFLSAIFASTQTNAQQAPFSYGGVEISPEIKSDPVYPRRPSSIIRPTSSEPQPSQIRITSESQEGFGSPNEYRLNYNVNLSPRFSANIQSPLIEETSTMRRGLDISGSPRLEFSMLLGAVDPHQSMSDQREGINYNPLRDPTIDQRALNGFDRMKARWQSETPLESYGLKRF